MNNCSTIPNRILTYKTTNIMRYLLLALLFVFSTNLFSQTTKTPQLKSGHLVWVTKGDIYGLYNTKFKKFIIEPRYDKAEFYGKNLSRIKIGKFYGFIDNSGKKLSDLMYETTINLSKTLILAKEANKFVLIPKENLTSDNLGFASGKLTLENEYDRVIVSYADNYAVVELAGKFGYINEEGEEVIPLKYEAATLFDGNIASVQFGETWGAINKDGKTVIDFKYKAMGNFQDGYAVAKNKKNKWSLIDVKDKSLFPFKYEFLTPMNDEGVAIAKNKGKYGLIDQAGEIIVPFKYDFEEKYAGLLQICEGYIWLKKDNKWGTVDHSGKNIIPFKYDVLNSTDGEEAKVFLGKKMQIVNKDGQCLQNCE